MQASKVACSRDLRDEPQVVCTFDFERHNIVYRLQPLDTIYRSFAWLPCKPQRHCLPHRRMENQRVAGVEDDAAGGGPVGRAGAILLFTATCTAATYRAAAAGDVASVAFVIVSYGALLLLLRFLREYELLAPPEAAAVRREGLRRRVWALCVLLTAMFAWKVAGVMTWPVAVGVWAAAALTLAGGFVLLFRQRRRL